MPTFQKPTILTNTLSVTGASTLSNTLSVTGNVTVGGQLKLTNTPTFKARYTTNANVVGDATNVTIPFNVVDFNVGSGYVSSGGSIGRFVAPVAGIYVFSYNLIPALGSVITRVKVNGTFSPGNGVDNDRAANATFMLSLAANDYVEVGLRSGTINGSNFDGHSFQGYLFSLS